MPDSSLSGMKPPVLEPPGIGLGLSFTKVFLPTGSVVDLPTITACYPRVCSLAKRQVTYSGRGKKMRSHLAAGRSLCNAHGIFQTRDIRDTIMAVKFGL